MTITLPETGPLPVIVPGVACPPEQPAAGPLDVSARGHAAIQTAGNTPHPQRHVPRPAALPPCPSWCDHDHSDDFGPQAIPADTVADGGPIWGFAHSRHVRVGSSEVLLWQYVAILVDGTVVDGDSAPDISWSQGEGETPEAASDLASALLAARLLVTRGGGAGVVGAG